jgi:hypothetical protein
MPGSTRTAIRLIVPLAAAMALAGCGAASRAPGWTFPPATAAGPAAGPAASADPMADMPVGAAPAAGARTAAQLGSSSVTRLDLTIVTGDMIGHTEFPAYIPSDFTLPAYSTIVVTITNFDDATALPAGMSQYASVKGTVGNTMTVTPIKVGDPNGTASPTQTLNHLDPATVSHTFTIPSLGINVPVAAHARVTFVIQTGAPGQFFWRCFDPCGDGATGWGTAMAAKRGFMEGTLTVA